MDLSLVLSIVIICIATQILDIPHMPTILKKKQTLCWMAVIVLAWCIHSNHGEGLEITDKTNSSVTREISLRCDTDRDCVGDLEDTSYGGEHVGWMVPNYTPVQCETCSEENQVLSDGSEVLCPVIPSAGVCVAGNNDPPISVEYTESIDSECSAGKVEYGSSRDLHGRTTLEVCELRTEWKNSFDTTQSNPNTTVNPGMNFDTAPIGSIEGGDNKKSNEPVSLTKMNKTSWIVVSVTIIVLILGIIALIALLYPMKW
jgi:hypothetical protein|tara:strand:- start:661 stop:1434 length:774 start_codon:yes stop_codon:yes gene_type:complete